MESHLKWLVVSSLIFLSTNIYGKKLSTKPIEKTIETVSETKNQKIKFKKTFIKIKNIKIDVELAETEEQLEYGLMFRDHLSTNQGMLFIFDQERPLSFWMKNTIIDLSIAYFDKNKKIVDIQEMKATSSLDLQIPSYPSKSPALYALEMNARWFEKNHIKVGDVFEFVEKSRQ